MPDPFNSDYVSAGATGTTAPIPAAPVAHAATAQTAAAVSMPAAATESKAYGFEPERYGLGKPRRIVVRGNIAIE